MLLTLKLRFHQLRHQLFWLLGLFILATTFQQLKPLLTHTPYNYPFSSPQNIDITGQLEQEIAFYKNRISQTPEDGLSQAALASTYLKLARATGDSNWYLLAEQAADQSLQKLPFNNESAQIVQAKVAEARHDFDQAIFLANQILTTQPYSEQAKSILITAYLGKGNLTKAKTIANTLVEQIPTLGSLTLRGLVHIAQGQDNDAIQDFEAALNAEEPQEAGSSAWTRTLMGRFYASRGDYPTARQLYQEALEILPRYPLALVHMAHLETRQGHYRSARKLYSQVFTSQDYDNVWDHVALQGMAQVASLQGNLSEAQQLWQQAEDQFRQHQDLDTFGHRRALAQLLLARGNTSDLPEALKLMEADIQVRQDAATLDTYAWSLMRLGRWKEAQQTIQIAIEQGTRNAVIFYRAGLIEQRLGNRSVAKQYFQAAQTTDPTFSQRDQQIWGLNLETANQSF
ncbi:MAG: tetratricopeptide repeat protein [Leptolyngbya sp. SIO3F4]|nr:tetratricopeptide repeat protein [Leptolyngbya sp. SIO3F4]